MSEGNKIWRERLLSLKDELTALDETATDGRAAVELDQSRVGRLSRMDALQSQAMNKAVAARRKTKLLAIDAALIRIEEDEFGYCTVCGDNIPQRRLELDPTAAVCLSCSR